MKNSTVGIIWGIVGVVVVLVIIGVAVYKPGGLAYSNQNATSTPPSSYTYNTTNNYPAVPATGGTDGTSYPGPATPVVTTGSSAVVSNSTSIVTGTVNPQGSVTSYWYEYGKSSALGSHTGSGVVGSGFSTLSAPGYITGLDSNTIYYYRLTAQNSLGTVSGVINSFTTGNTPPPAQAFAPTVTTRNADTITGSAAIIYGTVNPRGADTRYWFQYGKDSSLGDILGTISPDQVLTGTSGVGVSAHVTSLATSTKYYYRLVGQNQYGTVAGSILSFSTKNK